MDAPEQQLSQQLPQQLGPLLLESRIASGRLAGLFRAVDQRSSQRVLVRSLPPALVAEPARAAQTQQRIARALQIQHPHVHRVIECLKGKRTWWLVLEPLPGGPLEERMAAAPFSLEDAVRVAAQVARALQAIHASGSPHAALYPANLWINQSDDGMQATLLQYPLASDGTQAAPVATDAQFAPATFQAPEQNSTSQPTSAADIYCLGRLIEYLLSDQTADGTAAPRRRKVPPQLTTLIARLTAVDPARRPAMLTVLAELDRLEQRLATKAPGAAIEKPAQQSLQNSEQATVDLPTRSYDDQPPSSARTSKVFAADPSPAQYMPAASTEPAIEDSQSVRRILDQHRQPGWSRKAVIGTALGLFAAVLALSGWWWFTRGETTTAPLATRPSPSSPAALPSRQEPTTSSTNAGEQQAATTATALSTALWAAPVGEGPIELAHIPSGTQFLLTLRPAEFLKNSGANQILAGTGALGELLRDELPRQVGVPLEQLDQVTISLLDRGAEPYAVGLVAQPLSPIPLNELLAAWKNPPTDPTAPHLYRREQTGYWLPRCDGTSAGDCIVIAPWDDLLELVQDADQPVLLRGDMESLWRHTDRARLLNLVTTQNFLYSGGKELFAGTTAPLQDGIRWLLGDRTQSLALSAQLTSDALFVELRLAAASTERPVQAKQSFLARLQELPHRVSSFLLSAGVSDYSRPLLERFPRMLDLLVRYTRAEVDDRQTLYRAYLPIDAASNLAWGTHLALLEGNKSEVQMAAPQTTSRSIPERLRAQTSLSFPRDTLETAIELLSAAIDVPIEIVGRDLQADGITRNQSFGLDARDLPAAAILQQILAQANPDGKLVCVLGKTDQGQPQLMITTRAAAQRRQETPLDLEHP
jgi:serine/threonine protein kinase